MILTVDVPGFTKDAPEVVFHDVPARLINPLRLRLPDDLLISTFGKAHIFSLEPTIIAGVAEAIFCVPVPSNKKVADPPFTELLEDEASVRLPLIATVPVLMVQAPLPLIVTSLLELMVVPMSMV